MGFVVEEEEVAGAESGAKDVLPDGQFHVYLQDIRQEPEAESPYTLFLLTVRNGTDPAAKNRLHREYCGWNNQSKYIQTKNRKHILLFAKLSGAYTDAELKAKAASGDDSPLDWSRVKNRDFIIAIETGKNKDNTKQFPGQLKECGIYSLDDPHMKHVARGAHAINSGNGKSVEDQF